MQMDAPSTQTQFKPAFSWLVIHKNTEEWLANLERGRPIDSFRVLDHEQNSHCRELSSFGAEKWLMLCNALGMTAYGAVALSWCESAELEQVWEGWAQSGFPLLPKPEYERPARFINPALLPESSKLSDLMNAAAPNKLALCAMIVALDARNLELEFDVPLDEMRNAQPQIAAFLKSRMERKSARSEDEDALIAHWSETIKGTEWEV